MALNLSKISTTFKRKVTLYIATAKGTDDMVTINCDFLRWTKNEVQAVQDALDSAASNDERELIIINTLGDVWKGWDVVDDNGPKPFNRESQEELFNVLPGAMIEVFLAWVKGCSGRDRKNV
ncbi:MAG: hypothetical protein LBE32_00520 [Burkholderiales bacterium]|jgi:hypothetical protein|nr:hypothetical protein [Burkholderiales bacterium]